MTHRLHEPAELIDPTDRAARGISDRFTTWADYWAYMREAVAMSRTRARHGRPARQIIDDGSAKYAADSRARSIEATQRAARPGYCAMCGHVYPVATCPICADELAGLHAAPGAAWEALISGIA